MPPCEACCKNLLTLKSVLLSSAEIWVTSGVNNSQNDPTQEKHSLCYVLDLTSYFYLFFHYIVVFVQNV